MTREVSIGSEHARTRESVYSVFLERHEYVTGGEVAPTWIEGGAAFWFVRGAPEETVILRVDLATGRVAPMFDVAAVRAALTGATGREPPHRGLPFEEFVQCGNGCIEFAYSGATWRFHPFSERIERVVGESHAACSFRETNRWIRRIGGTSIEEMEVPEQLAPSGEWFASVQEHNIVLRSPVDGRTRWLTTCGSRERFWDIESDRWGSTRALDFKSRVACPANPWSPDSLTLLAYRRDVSDVFLIPCIHWLKPQEEVEYAPFQKAGATLHRVEPAFIDVRSRKVTPVAIDTENCHVQWLGWDPRGREGLLIVYNRELTRVEILAADRATGGVRTLLTESAETALKNQIDEVFAGNHGFHVLDDGNGFLWLSARDGWNHIYRYDWNGTLIAQLTRGSWPVYDVRHLGTDGFVYFTAAIDTTRPYDVHVCRVPETGGTIERLTREKGIHSPSFAPGSQAFLDTHSSVDRPVRTDLVRADGVVVCTVAEMDTTAMRTPAYVPPEEFTVKAADGQTELWGVLYKPFDFDPHRKYPVVECIYGGPQIIYAQRTFAVNDSRYHNLVWALAHRGYITLCLDARGTPGRSKAFQDANHRNWNVCITDHAAAIRQLCERHEWMDSDRVGIYGHSWGGYFATRAIVDAPDVYHAAVAYEPGYDPWQYIISEPYLGLPQNNRRAYEDADLIRQASRVARPLMILTGTRYTRVVSGVMKMVRALIEAGIDHELVVVPEATHSFVGVEEDYMLRKLNGWIDRHVKRRQVASTAGTQGAASEVRVADPA